MDIFKELKELAQRYTVRILLPTAPPMLPPHRITRQEAREVEAIIKRMRKE